jgi:hypothetical protein
MQWEVSFFVAMDSIIKHVDLDAGNTFMQSCFILVQFLGFSYYRAYFSNDTSVAR